MSISGNLRTMLFADLLQWVSQSRKTGTLVLDGTPFKKKVYFRDGAVVAASSENPKEFLTYYLVGWDVVSEEELEDMLALQERHGTLLGELLVSLGRLTREQLARVLQIRTEEAIYELFLWPEGGFRFLDNILPAKKFHALDLPVDMIVLEGVRRRDEFTLICEHVPDPAHVPKLVRAVDVHQMGELERAILREINGENSVERIALNCRLAVFPVLEFIYQGAAQGLFEILPATSHEELVSIPGFAAGAWRRLIREVETALAEEKLAEAYRRLRDVRTKYADHRQAQEVASGLDKKLAAQVDSLGLDGSVVAEIAIPLAEMTKLPFSPEEGFLLSRINGTYTLAEILKMVPGTALEVRVMVHDLMQRDVVRLQGTANS